MKAQLERGLFMQPGITQRGRTLNSMALLYLILSSNYHLTLQTDTFGTGLLLCGYHMVSLTEAGLHLIKQRLTHCLWTPPQFLNESLLPLLTFSPQEIVQFQGTQTHHRSAGASCLFSPVENSALCSVRGTD